MENAAREYPARPLVGVGIVLLRPDTGEVLLIRRGRPPAQDAWSLPGGAQRLGETAQAAAQRELLEETGLSSGPLALVAHVDSIHHDFAGRVQYHYTILDFCGWWVGGEPVAGGDAREVTWAAESRFDELDLWSETRRVVMAAKARMKNWGDSAPPDPGFNLPGRMDP